MNPKVLKVMRIESSTGWRASVGAGAGRPAHRVLAPLLCGLVAVGSALAGPPPQGAPRQARTVPEHLRWGVFQDLAIYRPPSGQPRNLVLFLSGERGWSTADALMAQALAHEGGLIAGIDDRRFVARLERGGGCIAPGSELDRLSRYIETHFHLSTPRPPLLAGYSAGATLAYAVAARAPRGNLSGLLTLGFSAGIALREPLCRGGVLRVRPGVRPFTYHLIPGGALPVRWINLTGMQDRIRPAPLAYGFVRRVPRAEMVLLPNVDHTFAVPRRWVPQLQAAYRKLTGAAAPQATSFRTTLPRTWPLSSVRCASATSSSG